MTTWCRQIRGALTEGTVTRDEADVAEHLTGCASCARFADRLELFRAALRDHHAGVEPDAGFAARIRGRLPETPVDLLGRAAWRLLPAGAAGALALAAALVWSAGGPAGLAGRITTQDDGTSSLVADAQSTTVPTDDPLGWLLEDPADPTESDR